MSDIASYMNHADFVRMLKAIKRTAKPGARFSIRQFMSDHAIPSDLQAAFNRNTALEKQFEDEERFAIYRFCVGSIAASQL